jgi:hypothetical protein
MVIKMSIWKAGCKVDVRCHEQLYFLSRSLHKAVMLMIQTCRRM